MDAANKPIAWTIPLFVDGGTLNDAAAGKYQVYYEQAAQILARSRPTDDVIYIRTGEEFNGDWMPWSATGREKNSSTLIDASLKHFVRFQTAFDSNGM
jgi:hypothetical protein